MTKKMEEELNYSFILNCLAAITTSAILIAGIILMALKALAATNLITGAKLALAAPAFFSLSGILPLVLFGITAAAILISICSGSCRGDNGSTVLVNTTPGYELSSSPSFWSRTGPSYITATDTHYHDHTRGSSNIHNHSSSGNFGGNNHGHSGGFEGGTVHHH